MTRALKSKRYVIAVFVVGLCLVFLWLFTYGQKVEFYGILIDQNGDPVVGAVIEAEILDKKRFGAPILYANNDIKRHYVTRTDQDGRFEIKDIRGITLHIEKMTKNGYDAFFDWGVKYRFVFNDSPSAEFRHWFHNPSIEKPVVFVAWKKGETEPLIMEFAKFEIETDKGINEVYYRMGLKEVPSPQPMLGWDIKVTGKNIPSADSGRQQDDYWEVNLTAGEGGGLVLTDSPHASLAPESGYQNSLTIKSTDQANSWDRPVRRAYYRAKGGEKYASFRLGIDIGSYKTGSRIYVTLADLRINPNSSRNLEYDPSKRIK